MADLVITPSLVFPVGTPTRVESSLPAGVDLQAGQAVVKDNDTWILADATAVRSSYGIVLNEQVTAAQLVQVMYSTGIIDLGVTLEQAMLYVIAVIGGGIAPITDLVATNFVNVIGYGNDVNQLVLSSYRIPYAKV